MEKVISPWFNRSDRTISFVFFKHWYKFFNKTRVGLKIHVHSLQVELDYNWTEKPLVDGPTSLIEQSHPYFFKHWNKFFKKTWVGLKIWTGDMSQKNGVS